MESYMDTYRLYRGFEDKDGSGKLPQDRDRDNVREHGNYYSGFSV